jgi:hypothetical protein
MKKILYTTLLIIAYTQNAFSQCAMCTKTAQGLDPKSAEGINNAIIYLALIPLSMIFGVFYYMYRSSKLSN